MTNLDLAMYRAASIAAVNAFFGTLESMTPDRIVRRPPVDPQASETDVALARAMREQREARRGRKRP